MQVLILGANGRLGRELVLAFAQAGWDVLAYTRREMADVAAGHVRNVQGELATLAVAGCDVVVNALNLPYGDWSGWPQLNQQVIALAQRAGAMLMLPGNVYGFGRDMPLDLAEDTTQLAESGKGLLRKQIEVQMQQAAGLDSVIVRAGDYFGGRGTGTVLDLAIAKDLAKGKVAYPGARSIAHAWAYLPDLAQTFVRLATQRHSLHGAHTFHFAGHTLTGNDWHRALEQIMQQTLKPTKLPWGLMKVLAFFVPDLRGVIEMRYLWDVPHQLVSKTLAQQIGLVPYTPIEQALRQALADLALLDTPVVSSVASPT